MWQGWMHFCQLRIRKMKVGYSMKRRIVLFCILCVWLVTGTACGEDKLIATDNGMAFEIDQAGGQGEIAPVVEIAPPEDIRIMSSWNFDITEAMEEITDDYQNPNYLLYVNSSHPISEDTYVGKMVPIAQNFSTEKQEYTDEQVMLEWRAAQALIEMLNKVNELYPDTTVVPDSGYRSIADQQWVMDKYIRLEGEAAARQRVSLPGTSNHHTGLAIDIAIWEDGKFIDDVIDTDPPIAWLHEHAYEYGFFLEFPKGHNFKYEPWHFRYVGLDNAKSIHDSGLLFSEWLAR